MSTKRILVTGGAGFIGSHIADTLIKEGHEVHIIDNLSLGRKENVPKGAEFHISDITETVGVEGKFDCIYHEAAHTMVRNSFQEPAHDANTNICGLINVLEWCRKSGTRKVIFPSSAAVYGNPEKIPVAEDAEIRPLSPYAISKHTDEQYIMLYSRLYGINYMVLRYSNVFGPRQNPKGGFLIASLIDKMLHNESPVIFGDGRESRDYVFVSDVVAANLASLSAPNDTLNIGSGAATTINEVWRMIANVSRTSVKPIYKDVSSGGPKSIVFDISRAEKTIGYRPAVSVEDGIRKTYEYYRNAFND